MWKLWSKSSCSQTEKRQQTLEEFFGKKTKTDERSRAQQKPTDSNRMVTVDTVEKSCKNVVLAKYIANDWVTYDRSGKHVINLKCLLCCRYIEHIDKPKGFKSEWIKGSTNFFGSK